MWECLNDSVANAVLCMLIRYVLLTCTYTSKNIEEAEEYMLLYVFTNSCICLKIMFAHLLIYYSLHHCLVPI